MKFPRNMPYCHIHGGQRRSTSKIYEMVQAERSLAMRKYGFVENKQNVMVCNISGWTHAALISQVAPSLRSPSTPCFAGIARQLNATFTYRMSLVLATKSTN